MNVKELKWYNKLLKIIMIILIVPFILFGVVILFVIYILLAPFEIIKYKKSAFFIKYNKKYSLGITRNHDYQLINYFAEKNINLIKVNLDYGYSYLYNDENIFIFVSFECIRYNDEKMKWEIAEFADFNFEDIDEYIKKELTYICNEIENKRLRLLIDYDIFNEKDINKALMNENFIIYKSIKELACKIENL